MHITLLGTGPAVGIPRKGHTDPACRDARHGGKSRRRRSSALVGNQNTKILIDAGPDVRQQLHEAEPGFLDALLITHGHRDAVGGLKELDRWVKKHLSSALPVLADHLTASRLKRRYGALPCLQFVPFEDFEEYIIKEITVTPCPVIHSKDVPTYGYLLNDECFYASDFGDLPEKTVEQVRETPLMVLDGTFWFERKVLPTHLTTDEAIAWGRGLKTKRLVLTQIGHTYPPHNEADRKLKQYLKRLEIKNPSVELGFDGMRIRA